MKINIYTFFSLCLAATMVWACSKDELPLITSEVKPLDPVAVTKKNPMKLYVHYMPWFETKETSGDGKWGSHWTFATQNPDVVDATGKREIASHYYPLIGPYASSDKKVLEYHLLLMKYSGVDGILIDWYGLRNYLDYPNNKRNTEAVVDVLAKVGIDFAIVYEDQTLRNDIEDADRIPQAKADMKYLEDNFFTKKNYIKVNDKPLLMVFGPQIISKPADWTTIFASMKSKPTFVTLFAHSDGTANDAQNKNAAGEYIWVDGTSMETKYTKKDDFDVFVGGAYPGFHDFYKEGGWGEQVLAPIDYKDGALFDELLQMAKAKNVDYLQLITWNDFGEGTMIEPTREFKYTFLNKLQTFSDVEYTTASLEYIYDLYTLGGKNKNNVRQMVKLEQAFYYLVSLQEQKAKALIDEVKKTTN